MLITRSCDYLRLNKNQRIHVNPYFSGFIMREGLAKDLRPECIRAIVIGSRNKNKGKIKITKLYENCEEEVIIHDFTNGDYNELIDKHGNIKILSEYKKLCSQELVYMDLYLEVLDCEDDLELSVSAVVE